MLCGSGDPGTARGSSGSRKPRTGSSHQRPTATPVVWVRAATLRDAADRDAA